MHARRALNVLGSAKLKGWRELSIKNRLPLEAFLLKEGVLFNLLRPPLA